jgi:pimeloyl-ACP methyl ester carboxylesterase
MVNGRTAGPPIAERGPRVSDVRSFELRVPVPSSSASADGGELGWDIAATVYLPAAGDMLAPSARVLVVMPGGGYNRRYFDLPVPGYSQAAHHVRAGTVVVAIDHLGAGDSSIPPLEVTTLPVVAAANHAAVSTVVDRLRAGTLAAGVPPVDAACVVGAGQSLGGHALVGMQAYHRTFDGVAMLGSSLVGTALPARPGAAELVIPDGTTPEQAAQIVLANTDWNWAFHWEDGSAVDLSWPPHDLASLVAADVAAGLPVRRGTAASAPPWGSLTWPGFGPSAMLPGAVADEAASIDVPVLLASGERDVCHPPAEEVAALKSATDISVLVLPEMAHMHNFAVTRTLLWERLDEFVTHVTRTKRRTRC